MANFKYFLRCTKDVNKLIEMCGVQDFKSLTFKPNTDNKSLQLSTNNAQGIILNGYAILSSQQYKVQEGDIITVDRNEAYELVYENNVKRNCGDSDSMVVKKMKVAPIFNSIKKECNGKVDLEGCWQHIDHDVLIFTPNSIEPKQKIAAFDLDGTIIKTKSGKRFPENYKDWEFLFPNVPSILQKQLNDFKLVIFTNQAPLANGGVKVQDFKLKISDILKALKVPMQVFISTKKTFNRKPGIGMWNILEEAKNDSITTNKSESYYVGDAAGRAKDWAPKKKKDHSNADRLFAFNLQIPFYTPEEFFLKQAKAKYEMPLFNPSKVKPTNQNFTLNDEQDVIVMVGIPGCGKSTFTKTVLVPAGYIHVNRDKLGSWQKCVQEMERNIIKKNKVVIDNTNCDKESRKRYIDCAKKHKVPIRCFVMNITKEHCKHNNKFREITDKTHIQVTDIIISSLAKSYEEPSTAEGFTDVIKAEFNPVFEKQEHEKLYKMYLLEQ